MNRIQALSLCEHVENGTILNDKFGNATYNTIEIHDCHAPALSALYISAQHPNTIFFVMVRGCVLLLLILQIAPMSAFRIALPKLKIRLPFDCLETEKYIQQLKFPVLIMHGTTDKLISVAHGKKSWRTLHKCGVLILYF